MNSSKGFSPNAEKNKVKVYNLPYGTTKMDVVILLAECPSIHLTESKVDFEASWRKGKNEDFMAHKLTACVTVPSMAERDKIINYFKKFKNGYLFANNIGIRRKIFVHKSFIKKHDSAMFSITKRSLFTQDDDLDVTKLVREKEIWDEKKMNLLEYISNMEGMLKERQPDLFISELEISALQKRWLKLKKECDKKLCAIQDSKDELKLIKEQFETLQMLQNE